MKPLQSIAMGMVFLVLAVRVGGEYDVIPDPLGWLLILQGLGQLPAALPHRPALGTLGFVALLMSVVLWFPSMADGLAARDVSLLWAASLPQFGTRRGRQGFEPGDTAGTVGGRDLEIIDPRRRRRQYVAIDGTGKHRRLVNLLAAVKQQPAGEGDHRAHRHRHAPHHRDARPNPHARPAAAVRAQAVPAESRGKEEDDRRSATNAPPTGSLVPYQSNRRGQRSNDNRKSGVPPAGRRRARPWPRISRDGSPRAARR